MSKEWVILLIVGIYLALTAMWGIIAGGKQKSVKDYFLGSDKVPWWAVCFSIVAAETSTLTFISIPGLAYISNLNFLQVTFGYLLGRIVISYFLLPKYFEGELSTAYSFLENRFGKKTRSFASIVFIFTRTAADGVRLFATAIPLKLLLDISYPQAILIIAVITVIYTYTGGVKGVIWVDAFQMFIYLGGAIISIFYIVSYLPAGLDTFFAAAAEGNKLNFINFGFSDGIAGFFAQPYTLIGGVLGGAFLSMASHGTDQLVVQRLLATKETNAARKAIIGSGVIVIFQFAIFLILGVLLYAYYGKLDLKPDEIFPKFILENLPTAVSGIIIAGLFAAAMSTLAGSMSSLASSTMFDLILPYRKKQWDDAGTLRVSRLLTIGWAGMLSLSAFFFMESPRAVVELALSIASFTYGGLLGTFILGIVNKRATQEDALAGFTAGIFVMITVITLKLTAWTWFTLIGVIVTVAIGSLLTRLGGKTKE